jgi:glutamate-1-semialdehyde 2,1-aminomutase
MTQAGTEAVISRDQVAALLERERESFASGHPASREMHERAIEGPLLSGVPMNWMTRWPGAFPIYFAEARGARIVDVDGIEYADLCLGDTGAMTGHSPAPTVAAASERLGRGITTMLPSSDALDVGSEMERRFGLRHWQFTLSATDANRFAIRLAREITGRPKILVFNHCYHGTVDETFASLEDGRVVARHGSVGPPVDVALTTRVVEFNDVDALERELGAGDVACVLAEPALTNVGIVLAEPGYHDRLREATREAGTLLVIDETHTLCCGPVVTRPPRGLSPTC